MLILERSVTKPFWMRIYKILARKIKKGQFHEVQGTGVLQVQCDSGVRGYVIVERYFNELRPVAWLYLWQDQDWQAWEVMQVFVFEKLRGQGLAKKLTTLLWLQARPKANHLEHSGRASFKRTPSTYTL